MRKRKIIKTLVVTALLAAIFGYVVYFEGSHNEPFKVSKKYIYQSKEIKNKFGPVANLRLALSGYSVNYDGPNGEASYKIYIYNKQKKASVFLHLQKDLGVWRVDRARLVFSNKNYINLPGSEK